MASHTPSQHLVTALQSGVRYNTRGTRRSQVRGSISYDQGRDVLSSATQKSLKFQGKRPSGQNFLRLRRAF